MKNISIEYCENFIKFEEKNWWFWGKNRILQELLKNYVSNDNINSKLVLDLGCGIGPYFESISKYGKVIGLDFFHNALIVCKSRHGFSYALQGNAEKLPFKDNSLDMIVSLDMLEHINDDIKALKEFNRILKPNGKLIIFVPAKMSLWSNHDVILDHKRRYEKDELIQKISSFFTIQKINYTNFFIFPYVWLVRQIERKFVNTQKQEPDFGDTILPVALILKLLYFIESKTINFIRYPFGVSLICVAEKK